MSQPYDLSAMRKNAPSAKRSQERKLYHCYKCDSDGDKEFMALHVCRISPAPASPEQVSTSGENNSNSETASPDVQCHNCYDNFQLGKSIALQECAAEMNRLRAASPDVLELLRECREALASFTRLPKIDKLWMKLDAEIARMEKQG